MLAEPLELHLRDCIDRQPTEHGGMYCRCPCHIQPPDAAQSHVHFHEHGGDRHAHSHVHEGSARDWHSHSTAEDPPPE